MSMLTEDTLEAQRRGILAQPGMVRLDELLVLRCGDALGFPEWQFEPAVWCVLPGLLKAFGPGPEDAWALYDFLTRPAPLLNGKTPLGELLAGRHDAVERILEATLKKA